MPPDTAAIEAAVLRAIQPIVVDVASIKAHFGDMEQRIVHIEATMVTKCDLDAIRKPMAWCLGILGAVLTAVLAAFAVAKFGPQMR